MNYHISIEQANEQLEKELKNRFTILMKNGNMSIEFYKPGSQDLQTPHAQDELYVIASGNGNFIRNGQETSFVQGDVIFVPAGMQHHFENYSSNFATWVIFYGDTKR